MPRARDRQELRAGCGYGLGRAECSETGSVMPGESNPVGSKLGTHQGDFCVRVGRTSFIVVTQYIVLTKESAYILSPKNW